MPDDETPMIPTYGTAPAYCTDEDIAVYSPGDVEILTPKGATVAAGRDGAFDSLAPWLLTSATVDFEAQGVRPSMLVVLDGGNAIGSEADLIRGSGEHFTVGAVTGSTLSLRRIGFTEGVGQPPGPAAGAESVGFRVCSLSPQIGQASDQINRMYGIGTSGPYRVTDNLADFKDLELAAVLTVLVRQYTVNNRVGDGDFAMKLKTLKAELDAVLSRVQLQWNPPVELAPPTGISWGRVSR